MFEEKTILITGGTGTVGSCAVDLFLGRNAGEIRIFSRDENKQFEMRKRYSNRKIRYFIGDVRDRERILEVMQGVDLVLHTAALKHVPSTEACPLEAVKTNVLGTENVLAAAAACGVKKVICTSTDKAVYPINVMALSKAMMEKVLISRSLKENQATSLACIRLGNVIGSSGSVVPTFIDQISAGQPLTVTNRQMTRFVMNTEEVMELILYAFERAGPGEIIIKKMDSCSIWDLAKTIGAIFRPEEGCGIRVTGLRAGEKMHEDLMSANEALHAVDRGKYYHIDMRREAGEGIQPGELNSGTVKLLGMEQLKNKLLESGYIQNRLRDIEWACNYRQSESPSSTTTAHR